MSTESDGDDKSVSAGSVKDELKVPPTRPSSVASMPAEDEPPIRQSQIQLMADPAKFPDDGPLSHRIREIDKYIGLVEQVVLFGLLATIILIATLQAVSTKLFGHSFLWSFDIVRAGTFAIAMLGAAFASRYASHLSMDVVSRFLAPRKRLFLRVGLALITMFAASLLVWSGMHLVEEKGNLGGEHTVPLDLLAAMIPVGAGLIILHTFLHLLIDVDYIVRGKVPPEKAPSAH